MKTELDNYLKYIKKIGTALAKENDKDQLLYIILDSAKSIANADGGSIYLIKDKVTDFYIFINDPLEMYLDRKMAANAGFGNIPLYTKKGDPNLSNAITCSIQLNKIIAIENAYTNKKYDLTGVYQFDKKMNYKTLSLLTIPLKNHEQKIIGGFQLINAKNKAGEVVPFSQKIITICETIAGLGGIILTQKLLIEAQKQLFDALIRLIALTIDEKSAYTSAHCRRVPILTQMLADAVNECSKGPLKSAYIDKEKMYELNVAAWLHDCGKVTTPEHILDKGKKLEALVDRIELIKLRAEILKRENIIKKSQDQKYISQLLEDCAFLDKMNQGGEYLAPSDISKIHEIFNRYEWVDFNNQSQRLITKDELENLSIIKGTLNAKERSIVNQHVSVTYKMLSSLPFPESLSGVPKIAGAHHEKIDGTGYPDHLFGDQLSIQEKILAIADIFEALTSADRPYKKSKKLSEALAILEEMKNLGQIDADLFNLFIDQKIYLAYADRYLTPDQIDI